MSLPSCPSRKPSPSVLCYHPDFHFSCSLTVHPSKRFVIGAGYRSAAPFGALIEYISTIRLALSALYVPSLLSYSGAYPERMNTPFHRKAVSVVLRNPNQKLHIFVPVSLTVNIPLRLGQSGFEPRFQFRQSLLSDSPTSSSSISNLNNLVRLYSV